MQKQTYCGGIKPSAEIMAQYNKPIPFSNKKFVIVSANGRTCTATTNANGYLKIKLKAGSYKVYEAWRYYHQTPDGKDLKLYDIECLKTAWAKVDLTIDCQKKSQSIHIEIDDVYCMHTIPCILNPRLPE